MFGIGLTEGTAIGPINEWTKRDGSVKRQHIEEVAAERERLEAAKAQAEAPQQAAPKAPAYEAPTQESVRQQIAETQAKKKAAGNEKQSV